MQSMTGFGQAQGQVAGRTCTIEIRSINHRFLESKLRLPTAWDSPKFEQELTQLIRSKIKRGSVHVSVQVDSNPSAISAKSLNQFLAHEYGSLWIQLSQLCHTQILSKSSTVVESLNTQSKLSSMVSWIANQPGVFLSTEVTIDLATIRSDFLPLFASALDALSKDRFREGCELSKGIHQHCQQLLSLADEIKAHTQDLPQMYRDRLFERVERLLKGHQTTPSPERIAQEVAILASHVDIQEEIARLKIHVEEVSRLCDHADLSGRQLDFLVQEIHRELNTLGAKSQSADISSQVIAMKTELERMREQIQNVE